MKTGKPTVQLDKVLVVLDALGIGLTAGGPGASFTAQELAQATVKREPGEPAPCLGGRVRDGRGYAQG